MKAVEGLKKHDYIVECKEEGGEVFGFDTIEAAAEYVEKMFPKMTKEEAIDGIKNNTNCDWVLFEDGSVIFRYYGKGYNEKYTDELRNTGHRM